MVEALKSIRYTHDPRFNEKDNQHGKQGQGRNNVEVKA